MSAIVKRKRGAQPGPVLSLSNGNQTCPAHSRRIASILQNDPQNLDVLFHAVSALGRTLRTRQSLVHAERQQSRDIYDSKVFYCGRGLYRRFVSWLKAEYDSSVK